MPALRLEQASALDATVGIPAFGATHASRAEARAKSIDFDLDAIAFFAYAGLAKAKSEGGGGLSLLFTHEKNQLPPVVGQVVRAADHNVQSVAVRFLRESLFGDVGVASEPLGRR